jgi:hypothetical protein
MIHVNKEARDRFILLAKDVFGLSIDDYLASLGRSLFGYSIDLFQKCFLPIFGDPPNALTDVMNTKFVDSIAGYKVNVGSVFPSARVNADVLLLSTELDSVPDNDFNSILLHEACHLVIDGQLMSFINLPVDEKAKYHGERLYKRTDRQNESVTKHSIQFCTLLAAGAQRYSDISHFPDRWAVINSAMRYDMQSNART